MSLCGMDSPLYGLHTRGALIDLIEDRMLRQTTIVIPCYNESQGLGALVQRCAAAAADMPGLKFLLVDNGSQDATAQLWAQLPPAPGVEMLRLEVNAGYGGGILAGLATTDASIVGWTHADLQTDPMDVVRAVRCWDGRTDPLMVKGRRQGRGWGDRMFTGGMTVLELALLRVWMPDINAQPTLLDRSILDTWDTPPTDFSLDLFAFAQAKFQQIDVRRVPVQFPPRRHGQSHWNVGLAGKIKFIRRTLKFSLQLYTNTHRKTKTTASRSYGRTSPPPQSPL